ncbi:MAG: SusD/RagB family nutrient-binding outer membrane lipoprotein [Robiginitalea sp.]|nr:SusD/RagB family nutrient-binding outer membrane lipoprotein [Robiginitalea sp.]
MKSLIKYITIVFIAGGLLQSCETTDLDLRTSPNELASDQADPNLLLTSVQLAYGTNQQTFSNVSAELTRIDNMFGRVYFNNYSGATTNGVWARTYSSGGNGVGDGVQVGILTNLQNLEALDAANPDLDLSFHIGVAKTLYAHSLMQLVDFLGEAAFTQAGNPAEFPAPVLDDGETVYDGAFALLGEAKNLLEGNPSTLGASDIYYNGDTAKWVKLVGTLQMKYHMMKGQNAQFQAIAANPANYISSSEDDFFLRYGTSELQPDTRHPDYAADYTPSGANIYQSNWLMETMLNEGGTADPRIRYYFYRQTDETPGAGGVEPDEERLACSLAQPPQHYIDGGFTYCSVPNGYWGRSHGNDEGTPPDNFFRTAVGVYPAGGRFDDNSFGNVGLGLGGGGAGIEPIIMSSYIDFWKGYMAGSDAERKAFMLEGIDKSITTVQTFGSLDGGADFSFEPDDADIAAYVAEVDAAYDANPDNVFAEQYFITLYGGATDAWNYYRLTGFPNTLNPSWEPSPGPFPLTIFFPTNEVTTNVNVDQRTSLDQPVFWNSGGCPTCY